MSKKQSITNLALLILEKSVDGYCRFEDFAYHSYKYLYGYPEIKKASLAQALKRLRESGFIEKDQTSGEIIYKLTKAGRDKAILMKEEDENWDGKWRIVIFDIPEKRRAARQFLRKKLIEWGFQKWQKSVWACKKNCTQQLEEIIKQVGIEDWVLVIESSHVGPHSF